MPSVPPAAAYYVPSLPDLPSSSNEPFDTYVGYLPVRQAGPDGAPADNAHLYFVLHRAMRRSRDRRLIIWLNGGPGCSSFDGLMMEIGAWRFDNNGTLTWTEKGGSWNEYADVLYRTFLLTSRSTCWDWVFICNKQCLCVVAVAGSQGSCVLPRAFCGGVPRVRTVRARRTRHKYWLSHLHCWRELVRTC